MSPGAAPGDTHEEVAMTDRNLRMLAAGLGVLAVFLLGVLLALVMQGSGSEEAGATTTTTRTTTTTSAPAGSGTTAGPASTAGPATSTTSTTTTSTTTPSTVAPTSALGLHEYGVGLASFGQSPDAVIAAVSAVLGPPDEDTGWVDAFSVYGTCPPPEIRGVHWGNLVLLFANGGTDFAPAGTEHFFTYTYYGSPPDLETTEGIGVGDTLAELQAAYPGATVDESPFDPSSGVWAVDTNPVDAGGLFGFASGTSPDATIVSILGGLVCGE